jgi:hypothetical protein
MNDIAKSLTDIAARIRHEHAAVRYALKHAVERAMTTGDLLLEAKEQVQHGQWTQWIQEHCEISDRTARLYMQLAENRATLEASENAANLTLNAAVRMLAAPKDNDEEKDFLEAKAGEIRRLVLEARKRLKELRTTCNSEDEFKEYLQQMFPDSTDPTPEQKEFADLICEVLMEKPWS